MLNSMKHNSKIVAYLLALQYLIRKLQKPRFKWNFIILVLIKFG